MSFTTLEYPIIGIFPSAVINSH